MRRGRLRSVIPKRGEVVVEGGFRATCVRPIADPCTDTLGEVMPWGAEKTASPDSGGEGKRWEKAGPRVASGASPLLTHGETISLSSPSHFDYSTLVRLRFTALPLLI